MENQTKTISFVCISDTHGLIKDLKVPPGDVLIHAGDFTDNGEPELVSSFNEWLGTLPHPIKIVIAGNHEISFDPISYAEIAKEFKFPDYDPDKIKSLLTNCIYLEDSSVTVHGYKVYGSPWGSYNFSSAFKANPGKELGNIWSKIPSDTEILITHIPPYGMLDKTWMGKLAGDEQLLEAVRTKVKPLVHVFGHIHEGYGTNKQDGITFINASTCTRDYDPTNKPIIFELKKKIASPRL